jgi:hypothetical protein
LSVASLVSGGPSRRWFNCEVGTDWEQRNECFGNQEGTKDMQRGDAATREHSVFGHERVAGTIDQPVTGAGDILAVNGVVALQRPIASKVVVVHRGSSVDTMRGVIACGRNAYSARPNGERSDRQARQKRRAFVERHGGLVVFWGSTS